MLAVTKVALLFVGLILICVILRGHAEAPAVCIAWMILIATTKTRRAESRRYIGESRTRNP